MPDCGAAALPAARSALGPPSPVRRDELPVQTEALARWLLGKLIVRELPEGAMRGRIVETEAYVPDDAACHAWRGETPRNRSLFLERGHAYVYISYGMHCMLNVSAEHRGVGAGVLIRALEPLAGIALMRRHRAVERELDLTRGPGRLAAALHIDRRLDGVDLCRAGPLRLADDGWRPKDIGASVRIGITRETDRVLRFYVRGNRFVSGPKRLNR